MLRGCPPALHPQQMGGGPLGCHLCLRRQGWEMGVGSRTSSPFP